MQSFFCCVRATELVGWIIFCVLCRSLMERVWQSNHPFCSKKRWGTLWVRQFLIFNTISPVCQYIKGPCMVQAKMVASASWQCGGKSFQSARSVAYMSPSNPQCSTLCSEHLVTSDEGPLHITSRSWTLLMILVFSFFQMLFYLLKLFNFLLLLLTFFL